MKAFAQDHALAGLRDQPSQVGGQRFEGGPRLVLFQEIDFLFGEIECGFDQHAQMDDAVGQVVHAG
ncbi:hypothetical protein D9M70_584100 [compost metagenome]